MTDEELAEGWVTDNTGFNPKEPLGKIAIRTFLGGLKAGRPKWHKVADGDLPKTQGVYLVYRKKGYQYLAFDGAYWVTGIQDDLYNIIIAWCEIPTFTDKEEIMEIEKIEQNLKEVKRTERGWAGHFCCSGSCKFRRNTLLECGDIKIVVSTIGAMYLNGKIEEIGLNRHYETMAFHVNPKSGDYKDADVSREIFFESNGALKWHKEGYIDNEANEMHEAVVKEISDNLAKGWLYED